MYLFTRQTRLAPAHLVDGIEWAVSITQKVNEIVSLDVGLWMPTLSAGFGTLSWGASVESIGDLEDAESKLNVDALDLDLVQQGAAITEGGLDDRIAQFVTGGTPLDFEPACVAVVESALANGNLRAGMAAGVEIAETATRLGGLPTSFLLGTTGTYGSCAWLTAAPSLRELERAEQAANADPGFLELVDERSTCFVEGATTQSIWRRIV